MSSLGHGTIVVLIVVLVNLIVYVSLDDEEVITLDTLRQGYGHTVDVAITWCQVTGISHASHVGIRAEYFILRKPELVVPHRSTR